MSAPIKNSRMLNNISYSPSRERAEDRARIGSTALEKLMVVKAVRPLRDEGRVTLERTFHSLQQAPTLTGYQAAPMRIPIAAASRSSVECWAACVVTSELYTT
jgi:hypothetical protein